jgi:hypothetical protein
MSRKWSDMFWSFLRLYLDDILKKHDHEMSYMVGSKNEVPSLGVGSKI